VYLRLEKLVRPETGELVKGFVAMTQWDARTLAERKYHVGDEVRTTITKRRNVKFHRLAHALGALLVDNVEGFESLDAHDALKRVQMEADVCCETVEMNASPVISAVLAAAESMLGAKARGLWASVLPAIKTIPVRQARSIAFDSMDEGEFHLFFEGIVKYVDQHYAHGLCDAVLEEYHAMVQGSGP